MHGPEHSRVLELLADGNIDEGWPLFLQTFSDSLSRITRRFAYNDDDRSECFLFVCEQLSNGHCARLRKFDSDGAASFGTWLHVVVYNLCRDWYRTRFPRSRPFRSVSSLPDFDRDVFRHHFERGLSLLETFESLRSAHPGITFAAVSAAAGNLHKRLSHRQRRILQTRRPTFESLTDTASDGPLMRDLPIKDYDPDPAVELDEDQRRKELGQALSKLDPTEGLILRLRFERELTLAEIANLMGLRNAQHADRRVQKSVEKLRRILKALKTGNSDKKTV